MPDPTDDLRAKLERAREHGFGPIELIDTSASIFPTTLLSLVGVPGRNGIGFAQIHHGLDEDNEAWGALFVDALNSLPTLLDQADRVEELEGALVEIASVGGWLSIESAPHGDWLLVADALHLCIAQHGRHVGWTHWHDGSALNFVPTHWQPLPAPPIPTSTEKQDE